MRAAFLLVLVAALLAAGSLPPALAGEVEPTETAAGADQDGVVTDVPEGGSPSASLPSSSSSSSGDADEEEEDEGGSKLEPQYQTPKWTKNEALNPDGTPNKEGAYAKAFCEAQARKRKRCERMRGRGNCKHHHKQVTKCNK